MRFITYKFVILRSVLIFSLNFVSFSAWAATEVYAGAEKCAGCHKDIYNSYRQSGHPYKIQKITDGPPTYPVDTSPGVPSPPSGMTWDDISYVIGGYGWKARFMDREGYILTGSAERQYNLANPKLQTQPHWTGYDVSEGLRKPYTCGSCHTTGWKASGKDGPHQDGLPGIYGTWASPGVTCEACHGPGGAHVAKPMQVKLNLKPNCDTCHLRGDARLIDASEGLVRHHEQYEDLLASPHRALACTTCHEPHLSTKYGLGGFKGEAQTCIQCHSSQASAIGESKPHQACIDCHMPYAVKTAVSDKVKYQGGVVPRGDLRSHIFKITSDLGWKMFSDDGAFVRTDDQQRAFLTLDYSCLSCHTNKDKAWAAKSAKQIHNLK